MYKNIELLNKFSHKDKSLKEIPDFLYSKDLLNAPITVSEFFEACKNYPIFFAKDKNEKWFATALLGYKEGENLFVDEKGVWKELHYIPAFVRRYPFILVEQENNEELSIAVVNECLVEDKNAERKLFDENNENSELLNNAIKFINQFHADSLATHEFIKQLNEWELLEENFATVVTNKNEKYNLNGFFIVNEEKLKHLSKKRKEEICTKNATPLITAHLISLSNIKKLGTI